MSLVTQLSRILPLPETELKQVLEYGTTLSKADAAKHFTDLLGDSPRVVDFISNFNASRQEPGVVKSAPSSAQNSAPNSDIDAVPKHQRGPKKKKPLLHTPAARPVDALPTPGTAYNKKTQEDEYMPRRSGASTPSNSKSGPTQPPPPKASAPVAPKPPPSAAGTLVSELGVPKAKPKSNPVSRTSTPGPGPKPSSTPAAKINIAGGTPMHGASTALTDLDAAIRSLEITTNPSLSSNSPADIAARRCNCVATRHPLQTAAPNCINCGKVVCVKEGLGPCTFCGTPLLSGSEVQAMIRELKAERGREKQAADRDAHRRPDVAGTPRPFAKPRVDDDTPAASSSSSAALSAAEAKAREHRDRLLGFQAQNARRTTVRDEAADFDVTTTGSMWASPEERARELKRQQKLLREMEWNARPDYEKRRQVVSIDLVGGKVVKKMMAVERPATPEEDEPAAADAEAASSGRVLEETSGNRPSGAGGAFSRNPLLGGMIKPVYESKGKGPELEGRSANKTKWRRVQDNLDDNEGIILDGGVYGSASQGEVSALGGDEPASS